MKTTFALLAAMFIFAQGVCYNWAIWTGRIQPVLTTWILFVLAVTLSLWTYRSSKNRDLVDNVGNTADVVMVWSVLCSSLLVGKDVRLTINPLEFGCIGASILILIAWRVSKQHEVSNLAIQTVMVVAYGPTLYQLWHTTRNTESFAAWTIAWIGSTCALIAAILGRNMLGIAYSSRSLVLTSLVLAFMTRTEMR